MENKDYEYYFNDKTNIKILMKELIINNKIKTELLFNSKHTHKIYIIFYNELIDKIDEFITIFKDIENTIQSNKTNEFKIYFKKYKKSLHSLVDSLKSISLKLSKICNFKFCENSNDKFENNLTIYKYNVNTKNVNLIAQLSGINIIYNSKDYIFYIIFCLNKKNLQFDITESIILDNGKVNKYIFKNNLKNIQSNLLKLKNYIYNDSSKLNIFTFM